MGNTQALIEIGVLSVGRTSIWIAMVSVLLMGVVVMCFKAAFHVTVRIKFMIGSVG